MKKIPTLFERNYGGNRQVRNEVTPGCEWVQLGEGVPTRKWDGTAVMVRRRQLYRRYTLKPGKTPPSGFEPTGPAAEHTGKQPGWIPVVRGPDTKPYFEAFDSLDWLDGTYELCGPKINGNPEKLDGHTLIKHGSLLGCKPPTDFDGLRDWLAGQDIEGVVWWHPDGRKAKIKKRDFGQKRV